MRNRNPFFELFAFFVVLTIILLTGDILRIASGAPHPLGIPNFLMTTIFLVLTILSWVKKCQFDQEDTPIYVVDEDGELSWEYLPERAVCIRGGVFWMKVNDENVIRVRPAYQGRWPFRRLIWMGFSYNIKYHPAPNLPAPPLRFTLATDQEIAEVWQQDFYSNA